MNLSRIAGQLKASTAGFGLAVMTASPIAQSAPGPLAQSPLFIGSSVPPNILFLVDDSSSMRYEVMTRDLTNSGAFTAWDPRGVDTEEFTNRELTEKSVADVRHRPDHPGCVTNPYAAEPPPTEDLMHTPFRYTRLLEVHFDVSGTDAIDSCSIAAEEAWRIRTSAFNSLYYDPTQTYEPWAGNDINGAPFADADVENALIDPFDPSLGGLNLLTESGVLIDDGTPNNRGYFATTAWNQWCAAMSHTEGDCIGWRYYTWNDDGNGLFDNGEETVNWIHQLSAEEQTNFANWFQYHRSREYATKFAISRAINDLTGMRVGLLTLSNATSTVRHVRIDDSTTAHRNDVLDALFRNSFPAGTTRLRERLNDAGNYFASGTFSGQSGDSPILPEDRGGACQLNATLMMTDGFYNDTSYSPPTAAIANADNDNGPPFADNNSGTLADIAMYYYETDASPGGSGLPNIIPTTDESPADHQHMNTYVVAFGLNGTLDPAVDDIFANGFAWPDPMPNDTSGAFLAQRIDDLWHASINGRGLYLSADNSEQLTNAFSNAVLDIGARAGSANNVGLSSFFLANDNTLAFVASSSSSDWSGDLSAFTVTGNGELSEAPVWSAAHELDNISPASRVIFSYNPESHTGIDFDWADSTTELSSRQQSDLSDGGDAAQGRATLQYLRGERAHESPGTTYAFRQRNSLIGDIVHSSPIYVGPPALFFPDAAPFGADGNRYSDFWTGQQSRSPTVYIGANDGMLHGFNTADGQEVLAYVPSPLYPKLADLADPNYIHQYYVDRTPTVADAFFNDAWHTVAVGGLGAGGRGIYALDITNPASFTADSTVLWEFTAEDDGDLGYTLSRPIVALTNAGPLDDKRWAVIVGNGYNADEDGNNDDAHATLFVLFLDANLSDGTWDLGNDYIKIAAPVASDTGNANENANENANNGTPNGLSSPAGADINRDGIVDRVYAGDVKGNLWAFDLSSTTATEWDVAFPGTDDDATPLFTATNAANEAQPITVKPSVIVNTHQPTTGANRPNLLVLFGTGQFLTTDDPLNTDTQTFYGIWDSGESSLGRGDLTVQTITELTGQSTVDNTTSGLTVRGVSDNRVPYENTSAAGNNGWLLDLHAADAATGERVIASPSVNGDIVFFATFIPDGSSCLQNNESWFMALNAFSGGPPPTPTININNDFVVDENDRVTGLTTNVAGVPINSTAGAPVLGASGSNSDNVVLTRDLDGGVSALRVGGGLGLLNRRLSWRELRPQ